MNQDSFSDIESHAEALMELIRVFETRKDVLRFPGVDAATLSAGLLEVEGLRVKVDEALAALGQAREALVERQQVLVDQARKAHAYASVFAQDDKELSEELVAIKFSESGKARKRRPTEAQPRKREKSASKEAGNVEITQAGSDASAGAALAAE